jgi:hypothetical protein
MLARPPGSAEGIDVRTGEGGASATGAGAATGAAIYCWIERVIISSRGFCTARRTISVKRSTTFPGL